MLIGYARVSKADGSQSLDLHRDALLAEGVEADRIYADHASGAKDDRPWAGGVPAGPARWRRAGRLETRPLGPQPRPPRWYRAGPRTEASACVFSPAGALRSTPPALVAASWSW